MSIAIREVRAGDEPAWIELRQALDGDAREVHVAEAEADQLLAYRAPIPSP